jgi:hypothetical protein
MAKMTPAQAQDLLNGPATTPPFGETTNFDNPETNAMFVVPTIIVALVLTTVALSVRIYTRRIITRTMGWDDCRSPCSESIYSYAYLKVQTHLFWHG